MLAVIRTSKWLYEFIEACEKKAGKEIYFQQCEILCEPLMEVFPNENREAIHYELLQYGLFEPTEWASMQEIVKEMEKRKVWELVNKEYKRLRKKWGGPKVPVYIFPIKLKGTGQGREPLPVKNGVAYKKALFLFLSKDLSDEEIKATLVHEYNHVCRLNYLDLTPSQTTLADSLIIEGLGEYAVKEECGSKWLAPWVALYPQEDAKELWENRFKPSLNLKGVKNHQLFLFGRPRSYFPKWIGYHLGFQIVDTYVKNHGPFPNSELYQKSTEEIIAGCDFSPQSS